MSESALKFDRRKLRRAFGETAINAMTQSMSARDATIAELTAMVHSLNTYVESAQRNHDLRALQLENRITKLEQRRVWHRAFWRRG